MSHIFSRSSAGKESACSAGDPSSISGSGDPLEEGMATHSSILAWRVPWTEEPGGLQSIGLQSWTRLKWLGSSSSSRYENVLVTQSYPSLCDPMDYSLPDFSVHVIFQARILEWVAIPFSRGSSQLRDQTQVSCIAGGFFKQHQLKYDTWVFSFFWLIAKLDSTKILSD